MLIVTILNILFGLCAFLCFGGGLYMCFSSIKDFGDDMLALFILFVCGLIMIATGLFIGIALFLV